MRNAWSGLILAGLLTVANYGLGAGFALYEGSAKGNALGGTIGSADDPSAIFFNPAGITQIEGQQLMFGVSAIIPSADVSTWNSVYEIPTRFEGDGLETQVFVPPHIYYTRQLSSRLWLGAGIYSRFGLGTRFDDNWAGRYSNVDAQIQTVTFNPNLAWKVNDRLSVAIGARAMYFEASFEQAIDARFLPENNPDTTEFDAYQKIEGETEGYGFNASIHVKPNSRWSFGLSYYSEVEQELDEGVARFRRPAAPVPSTWFQDTNVRADPIDFPEMIMLGFNYRPSDRLAWEFGFIRTGWSSIESLTFHYQNPIVVVPGLNLVLDEVTRVLAWEDADRWNLGVDYKFTERCNLMGGITWDQTPIPDETISYLLPTSDRQLLNFGIRYHFDKWIMDASFNYLVMSNRDVNGGPSRQLDEGVLVTRIRDAGALLFGFSLSRKF